MRRKYFCAICAWVYDPALGDPGGNVKPGTAWAEVPDDWVCPLCGVGKERFFVMS
jgi:rubredoxin